MKTARKTSRRGYTLVELMVALSIFTFSSMAISSLMFATYETNRHVKGMSDASSAAELTLRRIIEVARSATDLQYTDPQTGLYIQTPPDSSNLSYVFIYYMQTDATTGLKQLHEKIETAVANVNGGTTLTVLQDQVIVTNINSFSVARQNAGSFPESYQVNLVLNATPVPVSRSVVVTGRNLSS